MYRLEVIATNLAEAVAAQTGGAHSVEVCVDLAVGGLTPPLDTVHAIRDALSIDINMMVRPHAENFYYSPHDIDLILQQAEAAASIGVTSIVFGALTSNREVDAALVQQVKTSAGGLRLTFHRALDEAVDPTQGILALRSQAERLLCSGGAPDIWQGREQMGRWVRQFGDQFTFACAGGVTLANLPELVRVTGAPEYHVGSAARAQGVVQVENVRALADVLQHIE